EDEGIPFVTQGEGVQDLIGAGRMPGGFNLAAGPVRIHVERRNAARAREVLAGIEPADGSWSTLNGLGGLVPGYGAPPKVRLIRHVTRQRRVVTEHDVLHHRFPGAYGFKERPLVWPDVVEVRPAERDRLRHRYRLAHLGIVLLVPLGEVGLPQRPRVAARVIAGVLVLAGLGREGQGGSRDLQQAL